MARSKSEHNGELSDAVAALIRSQALLVQTQAEALNQARATDLEMAELRRESARMQKQNDERVARIERILIEHTRILEALPEAVRQKIGFRPPS